MSSDRSCHRGISVIDPANQEKAAKPLGSVEGVIGVGGDQCGHQYVEGRVLRPSLNINSPPKPSVKRLSVYIAIL